MSVSRNIDERPRKPNGRIRTKMIRLVVMAIMTKQNSCVAETRRRRHRSNHAVIVSSSRFWFNYRHVVNALSIYQLCKSNGIPDENIVLFLADEIPTNPRNPVSNGMYSRGSSPLSPHDDGRSTNSNSLYDETIEIDYRGDDVTVENFAKVLLGRHDESEGDSRRLHTDQDSHLLIYWTGHGGDQFFKFQDVEEITSVDIAQLLRQMHVAGRYKEILFVADTCQAFTLFDQIPLMAVPNVYQIGSSLRGENSYAHHSDPFLGLSVIERYTHALVEFVTRRGRHSSSLTLKQVMVDHLEFQEQRAHVGYRDDGCERKINDVPWSDFFANIADRGSAEVMIPSDLTVAEEIFSNSSGKRFMQANETKREFPIEPSRSSQVGIGGTSEIFGRSKKHREPSDPLFLAFVLGFVGAAMLASQFV